MTDKHETANPVLRCEYYLNASNTHINYVCRGPKGTVEWCLLFDGKNLVGNVLVGHRVPKEGEAHALCHENEGGKCVPEEFAGPHADNILQVYLLSKQTLGPQQALIGLFKMLGSIYNEAWNEARETRYDFEGLWFGLCDDEGNNLRETAQRQEALPPSTSLMAPGSETRQ